MGRILGEQIEALEHSYVKVKEQKLVKVCKTNNVISIIYKLRLDKNLPKMKHTDIQYQCRDGVSESNTVNKVFSHMSHYV